MKQFLKIALAAAVGVIAASLLVTMCSISLVSSLATAGKTQPDLPKSGVLTIDMSKITLSEQSEEVNPLSYVSSQVPQTTPVGLWDAVQAINAAATDPAVKFIYLKTDGLGSSVAATSELRASLDKFRACGKAVVAYMENPGTLSYYLASVADKVYMTSHTGGTYTMTGVGSQMFFLGDLLDKLGIHVQLIRHGKYKSAGEMYVRSEPSPENREQYQQMVNSLWDSMSAQICTSRGICRESLDGLIDGLKLALPQDWLDAGLVDGLLTRDSLMCRLAALSVVDSYSDVKKISLPDYIDARVVAGKARQKIAVIYADGQIVDGALRQEVAGDRFAAQIEKVRADSSVKAVVLRVNSPGGSVVASEKIKRELDLLKAQKPLVASYGDYAASGGYWISNNADKIFSSAVTLTGSIGVFGMVPDVSKALKDVAHVGVASIGSHKHSDIYSMMRPLDKDENAYMLRSIEDIYDTFTSIVAEGRSMDKADVDAIGQGRVWTGADALRIGLVDEIGTLEDAINYAALCAGDSDLTHWSVKGYPRPLSAMEEVMMTLSNVEDPDEAVLCRVFGKIQEPRIEARMPYELRLVF